MYVFEVFSDPYCTDQNEFKYGLFSSSVGYYKECSSAKVFIKRTAEERQAFSQKFYLEGKDCCWCHEFYSSLEFVFSGKDPRGKKPFEIYDRYVLD